MLLRIALSVSYVNVIKFIVVELLVSMLLEPAWEVYISRTAHHAVVRGRGVHLRTLRKLRSWPCALFTNRRSYILAVILSLTAFGGAFLSEYAISTIAVDVRSKQRADVYTLQLGRASENWTVESVGLMIDNCLYRDGINMYVNATFVDGNGCVNNDAKYKFAVSDVCVLSKKRSHDYQCFWNETTGKLGRMKFTSSSERDIPFREIKSIDKVTPATTEKRTANNWNVSRLRILDGSDEAKLYCPPRATVPFLRDDLPARDPRVACIYVSERWVILTWFIAETLLYDYSYIFPLIVYRNLLGIDAFDQLSESDRKVVWYFRDHFQTPTGWSSGFDVGEHRTAQVLMLILNGFGRLDDTIQVRDFRLDTTDRYTQVNLLFIIPLLVAALLSATLLIYATRVQPRRSILLSIPTNVDSMMRCARARQVGKHSAFGHPQNGLMLGLANVCDDGQRFTVDACETVPYNPNQRELLD